MASGEHHSGVVHCAPGKSIPACLQTIWFRNAVYSAFSRQPDHAISGSRLLFTLCLNKSMNNPTPRIALAQINTRVGDVKGNVERIIKAAEIARDRDQA